MNLPARVNDLSLLEHEPLRNYVAVFKLSEGRRMSAKQSVTAFVKEMQKDDRAAAAAKKWASLVFQGILSDENSFKVTDRGEKLYEVFFEYQCLLHQGTLDGNFGSADQYEAHVHRSGISFIKAVEPKDNANAQHSAQGRGSKGRGNRRDDQRPSGKKAPRQTKTGIHCPDAGDAGESSNPGTEFPSTTSLPATGVQVPTLPEAAKTIKPLKSKKEKKRRASSQKPPIITPSDVSEDDKEPSEFHAITATSSESHRSKRIASNPSCGSDDLPGVKDQAAEPDSTHSPQADKQHREDAADIFLLQPKPLAISSRSDSFVSHSNIKGKRGTGSPLSGRRRNSKRVSNVSSLPGSGFRKLWKDKLNRDSQSRASKRMRRASMSMLDSEPGKETESTHNLRVSEPTIQRSFPTAPPRTGKSVDAELKTRTKRTRLEFETLFTASDENTSADSHEFLGPDVRSLRPLPRKVRNTRFLSAVHGTLGASSLEYMDQFMRDIASNALVVVREGVEPNITDWTEDKDQDIECDDLGGDDQDEESGVHVTTETCALPKAPVPSPPRIWAQSRQEVCESFEYFRCYHSGVYSKDDIVKGYLLGAYAASRDIFHHGGKFIISHGGGKSESILDTRRGPKRYQTDQDQEATDKSVRALLKTCRDRRPIVLLADDKYALFPYDLTSANYTYVVLGLYWISHAWAECQSTRDGTGRIVRWKFAFQWCEGQSDPWWLPQEEMTDKTCVPPNSTSRVPPTKSSTHSADSGGDQNLQCEGCQEHSPFIYSQGWMCLNPRCDLFWCINGEEPTQLDYREEFLNLLPQKFDRLPNITPARLIETPGGVTTTYAFSKGWHCTNCGRLSCRFKWEHWECSNCKFKHVVNGRVRSPKEFWHQRPSKGFLHSYIGKDSGILTCRPEPINLGTNKGFTNRLTFILPHDKGKIHLILGTPLSNGNADNIFQMYQQQASTGELRLRRYPLRNHRARGLLLTNYFSQNSGEPYQYVGGSGQTVPFCEAPDCVRQALALIKERANLALHIDIPFNEVLSAAYMERQKMAFHSDSEKGLGPTVASLSLGSAALMHFRPHVNVENPAAKSSCALTLVLRHGDVLVMDGEGVQKYYEHTVVPMNFRIAATARCIGT